MSKLEVNEIAPKSSTGIGIGGTNSQPGAILNVQSTEQGVSFPRMTTTQRNDIPSPFNGLLVYNTDLNSFEQYNGTVWESVNGISSLNGQTAKTQIINTGTSGTAPNISQSGSNTNTVNIPLANQSSVTAGLISKIEYDFFNEKVDQDDDRLSIQNVVKVKLNPGTDEFSSIATALASITTASESNPFLISVGPGTYTEPQLVMKPYVFVEGAEQDQTRIITNSSTQHAVVGADYSGISKCYISGALASGYAAIYYASQAVYTRQTFFVRNVRFGNNDTLAICDSDTATSILFIDSCMFGQQQFNRGFVAQGTNTCAIGIRNTSTWGGLVSPYPTDIFLADSATSNFLLIDVAVNTNTTSGNCIHLSNGGGVRAVSCYFKGFSKAIWSENVGSASSVFITGTAFEGNTQNIVIDHPGTSGFFSGFSEYEKTYINPASSFFIANKDLNVINVAKRGGDFSSIKDAIDSITTAAEENPFVVKVGPGLYIEDEIIGKPYVTVIGENSDSVIIEVDDSSKHVIVGDVGFNLKNVTLQGATDSGKYAIYFNPTTAGTGLSIENVVFGDNYGFINCYNDIAELVVVTARNIGASALSAPTIALSCESTLTAPTIFLVDGFAASFLSPIQDCGYVTGSGALLAVTNLSVQAISGGRFLRSSNGGRIVGRQTAQEFFTVGLEIENVGAASEIQITGAIFNSITSDIIIDHPGTSGAFQGLVDSAKVTVNSSSPVKLNYLDSISPDVGEVTLGDIFQGDRHDRRLALSRLVRETSPTGAFSGGVVTATSGLGISVSSGSGFAQDPVDNYMKEVTWSTTPITLPADSTNYIYVTDAGTVTYNATEPNIYQNIVLGRVSTYTSTIHFIDSSSIRNNQLPTRIEEYQREAIGPIYSAGSLVSENGTRELDVGSGVYYFGNTRFSPAGGTSITWGDHYRDGSGGFNHGTQSTVDNANYDDDSGTLAPLTTSYYAKHALYVSGDGANEKYHLVYSQTEYSALALAQQGDIPIPPTNFIDGVTLIASIIVQEGATNITEIRDERPIIGFKASGVSATTFHGNLLGLLNDDHTQYLLVNGSRAMSGSLDMGGNQITNVGNVDGVDISAHGSRHLPNGVDPISTAAPLANLTLSTTNAAGTANSISRSDHSHALDVGLVGDITTIQPDDTASAGTSDRIARADHRHALASGTPESTGTSNSEGVSTGVARLDHVHDTVITNTEVESSTAFTTTSASDVIVTGFTTTPSAGTYLVLVSMEWVKTAGGSPQTSTASLYVASSQITNTTRSQTFTANTQFQNCKLQTITSFDGSQAVDVRVNITGGTTLSVNERSLVLVRLGP